jgi:hypothetical protein
MTELNCCVDKTSLWYHTYSQTSPPEPTGVRLVDPQDNLNEKWLLGLFHLVLVAQIIVLL